MLQQEVKWLKEDVRRLERKLENAPYESKADQQLLDEVEWQEGLAAAEAKRCALPNEPCLRIANMRVWVDDISRQQGIYWSPREQAAFLKRYADYYARNK